MLALEWIVRHQGQEQDRNDNCYRPFNDEKPLPGRSSSGALHIGGDCGDVSISGGITSWYAWGAQRQKTKWDILPAAMSPEKAVASIFPPYSTAMREGNSVLLSGVFFNKARVRYICCRTLVTYCKTVSIYPIQGDACARRCRGRAQRIRQLTTMCLAIRRQQVERVLQNK